VKQNSSRKRGFSTQKECNQSIKKKKKKKTWKNERKKCEKKKRIPKKKIKN